MKAPAAIFLDRDGTINVERNYLYKYEDWEWLPGVIEAIKRFNEAGFLVLVVSNQAGIARGFYTAWDVDHLHATIDTELARYGARIDAYYYCPHHPDFGEQTPCDCRKPAPGLLLRAQKQWGVDLRQSFLIGDKADDIKAGEAAGVTPILVATGYGSEQKPLVRADTLCVDDISAAVRFIFGRTHAHRAALSHVGRSDVL
ncbi:MAG: D-glycero-beta-D-manno-heptose 1,7-bisphosphate 7-phosphatase [Candidatus Tectimicrobiota bacterium]